MANADIFLLFCFILLIVFVVLIVKLINFLQNKIYTWSLENNKSKQDREEIKELLKQNNELLKEINAELKKK